MKGPQKISDNVYQVGGGSLTASGDCSFYAVGVGGGKFVLIDCGVGNGHAALIRNLTALGFSMDELDTLILTHCHIDHIGDAYRIKSESGCRIVAHKDDSAAIEGERPELTAADWYGVEYVPVKIDKMLVEERESMMSDKLEFICHHTPGHTPGSISVSIVDGDKKVLFGQDIHGPFDPSWGSDLSLWRSSMKKLLDLEADVLCEGHYGVFTGKKAVRRYIEGYLDRC